MEIITIIKNKRKSKCRVCRQMIDGKYKAIDRRENIFHLSCAYKWLLNRLAEDKKAINHFTPTIKKHMIVEKL